MRKLVKKMITRCWVVGGTVCLICTGGSAWANVTLKLPKNIVIVAENGKKTKVETKASLPDGNNQLVIRFAGELSRKHADENADFESSDTFVVLFNASNQSLKMVTPRIQRLSELEKWNKNPNIRILDSANTDIDIQIARLEKEGIQIFRDYETELEAFNKTDSPAALGTLTSVSEDSISSPAKAVTIPSPKKQSGAADKTDMAEDMLEYWYQQADENAKARFKQRINKQ